MVADELDAWNDDGVRIQASGRWTLQGVGVLLGGAMVAPPCSSKKTRKHEGERERGNQEEGEKREMARHGEHGGENPRCSLQRAPPWLPHFSVRIRTPK